VEELTLGGDEEVKELESHERIGQISQELLEKGSELYRIVIGEVDSTRVAVESFSEVFKSPNVSVLSEDSLDRHVYEVMIALRQLPAVETIGRGKNVPICFIAEMTSSTKEGIRSDPGPAPCIESAPFRSTRTSSGIAKTPERDGV
jgi:hypothetical protein